MKHYSEKITIHMMKRCSVWLPKRINPRIKNYPPPLISLLEEEDERYNGSDSADNDTVTQHTVRRSQRLAEIAQIFGSILCFIHSRGVFLGIVDFNYSTHFGTSTTVRYLEQSTYVIDDGFTVGNEHPCGFSVKIQTHSNNTLAYNGILRA